MNNAQEHQTVLAKLLSTENITVRHGNFNTAFFDVEDRILGLPVWKDKGKDVYDLLVGHEVGHALFTPRVRPDKLGLIAAYVNVVEDIRIEKMIQRRYPGLIASFRRGYGVLLNDNFFATQGKEINELFLVDRLNLHAKVGSLASVTFSDAERPVVNQCLAVETWKDVLKAAKALEDFIREEIRKKQEEAAKKAAEEAKKKAAKEKADKEARENASKNSKKEKSEDEGESDGDGDEKSDKKEGKKSSEKKNSEKSKKGESEDAEQQVGPNDALDESAGEDDEDEDEEKASKASKSDDKESIKADEEDDNSDEDGDGDGEDSDEEDEDTDEDGDGDSDESSSGQNGSSDKDSEGDESDEENDRETSSRSAGHKGHASEAQVELPGVSTQTNFDQAAANLVDKSAAASSTTTLQNPSADTAKKVIVTAKQIADIRSNSKKLQDLKTYGHTREDYIKFIKETKKYVNVIAREFEQRKAAFQYSRASIAQTGSLNMNKLHSYRYNEDIFLRTMKMADAKSHGMMMFVDYSGSMDDTLHNVVKQLINLVLFCRQVGIPFQVYGFTDHNDVLRPPPELQKIHHREGDLQVENIVLLDLINHKMSKAQMNLALEDLYFTSRSSGRTQAEALGGTPLNETLIIAHRLVKNFQLENNIQKMNVVLLTDGEGNCLQYHVRSEYDKYRPNPATSDRYDSNKSAVRASRGVLELNGKRITINLNARPQEVTELLLNNLRATTHCKILGFFIPKDMNQALAEATRFNPKAAFHGDHYYNRFRKSAFRGWDNKVLKAYQETKTMIFENKKGFDLYTIVAAGTDLDVRTTPLNATPDMTRGQLIRAFDEFSSSKKTNRVFITKFAEVVS